MHNFSNAQSPELLYSSEKDPAYSVFSGDHSHSKMSAAVHRDKSKLIAFYPSQNHHIPGVIQEQAELAKLFGLHGFCFYYDEFSDCNKSERLLESFLNSDIDINFCLCLGNESWVNASDSLIEYFNDKRYIRVDEKPMLIASQAKDIPDPKATFAKWRNLAKQHGFTDLHIVVDCNEVATPKEIGADALLEFPSHQFNETNFAELAKYSTMIEQSCLKEAPAFKLYRGISSNGNNAELYGQWLSYLRAYTRETLNSNSDNFIFIDAWNVGDEVRYWEQTLKSSFYTDVLQTTVHVRKSVLQYVANKMVSGSDKSEQDNSVVTEQTLVELNNESPASHWTHEARVKLLQFPILYKSVRFVYRLVSRAKKARG